jgi:hypothetical protein
MGTFEADVQHGVGMRRTLDGQYFFQRWERGVLIAESPSDHLNWRVCALVRFVHQMGFLHRSAELVLVR